MDFYNAYHYLEDHPIFHGRFLEGLYMEVVKVDPETRRVEDERSRNTMTEIWLEAGPYREKEEYGTHWTHDIDLDCGGATFEEAIIELARLVREKYDELYIDFSKLLKIGFEEIDIRVLKESYRDVYLSKITKYYMDGKYIENLKILLDAGVPEIFLLEMFMNSPDYFDAEITLEEMKKRVDQIEEKFDYDWSSVMEAYDKYVEGFVDSFLDMDERKWMEIFERIEW